MWRWRWTWRWRRRVRITVEGRLGRRECPGLTGRALAAAAHAPALDLPAGRRAEHSPAPVCHPDRAVRIAAEALTLHAAGARDLPAHRAAAHADRRCLPGHGQEAEGQHQQC
eukprot:COSAG02_NODE_120_length_35326_cov_39.000823_10_plen_112_part_00